MQSQSVLGFFVPARAAFSAALTLTLAACSGAPTAAPLPGAAAEPTEPTTAEAKAAEAAPAEAKAPEAKAPEAKAPEAKADVAEAARPAAEAASTAEAARVAGDPAAKVFAGTAADLLRAPVSPFFTTWQYEGTFYYTGGTGTFFRTFFPRVSNYVLIESPVYCAPRLLSVGVTALPFNVLQPVLFVGQRIWNGYYQSVFLVNGGAFTSVNGIGATVTGAYAWPTSCPINYYTIQAY